MKIAIIGSGISGISSALICSYNNLQTTLFEKNNYLGGHTRTISINHSGRKISVDTGFIVLNERTYPNLLIFFAHLGVEKEKSDMSFAASIIKNGKNLEYGCKNLGAIFANKKNLIDVKFLKCLYDIFSFFKKAKNNAKDISLRELIIKLNLSDYFRDFFIIPIASAIWSSKPNKILDYPAEVFINFFENHGLLSFTNQPQWFFVKNNSKDYVEKFQKNFKGEIKLNTKIIAVEKLSNGKIELKTNDGVHIFDKVIFASHGDQTFNMLKNQSKKQKAILKNFAYQENHITVHKDVSFMPKNKKCWSSWNYKIKDNEHYLTYWMNNLQNIDKNYPVFVTLNAKGLVNKNDVFDEYKFEHPLYNFAMIQAQKEISAIQGEDNIYYAGAYLGYGFHEDGIKSAIEVAKKMNLKLPW